MASLAPCAHCHRHVRVDEVKCPFCGETAGAEASRALGPALPRRAGRAAFWMFSAAALAAPAACGDSDDTDSTQDDVNSQPVYGVPQDSDGGATVEPPATSDAGADPASEEDAAPTVTPVYGVPQPVYGAPLKGE